MGFVALMPYGFEVRETVYQGLTSGLVEGRPLTAVLKPVFLIIAALAGHVGVTAVLPGLLTYAGVTRLAIK